MSSKAMLSTGQTISVDSSSIDVKFTRTIDELNASLTRNQKALHLSYNANGELTDALGRCVEGLSLAQIRLGMWADEEGRARTINGGFIDGLSQTEIQLGRYADEVGNVFDKNDELVRSGVDAKDVVGALADAAGATSSAIRSLGLENTELGRGLIALSDSFSSAVEVAEKFKKVSEILQTAFPQIKKLSTDVSGGFKSMTSGAAGSASALKALEASLGPIGLGLMIAAPLISEIFESKPTDELSQHFEDLEKKAEAAGDSIKGIDDALRYGALSANKYESALSSAIAELERLNETGLTAEQQKVVDESWNDFSASINAAVYKYVDNVIAGNILENEKEKAIATIDKEIANLLKEQQTEAERLQGKIGELEALIAMTKDEKVREALGNLKSAYENKLLEEQQKQAEQAQRETEQQRSQIDRDLGYREEIANVDKLALLEKNKALYSEEEYQKRLDAINKENLEAKEEAAKKSRADLLSSLGVSLEPSELDSYAKKVKDAEQGAKDGYISSDELAEVKKQLAEKAAAQIPYYNEALEAEAAKLSATEKWTKEIERIKADMEKHAELSDKYQTSLNYAEEQLAQAKQAEADKAKEEAERKAAEKAEEQKKAAQELGIDDWTNRAAEQEKAKLTELERLQGNMRALNAAYKQGQIAEEDYARGKKALSKLIDEEKENQKAAQKEEKARRKNEMRSALGIDSLLEEMKSPLDKYREMMDKIATAFKNRAISREERNMLEEKAASEYWKSVEESSATAAKGIEKMGDKLGNSMKSGSTELYLAQVKNSTNSYQSRVQANTEKMRAIQERSLYESQQTNYYLASLASGGASAPTFFGRA